MTILGPLLMASLMIVPFYVSKINEDVKDIDVVDETGIYYKKLNSNKTIHFHYLNTDIATAKENFSKSYNYALLYIPKPTSTKPTFGILYYASRQPGMTVTSYIQDKMKYVFENKMLNDLYGIDKQDLESVKSSVTIQTENVKTGENSSPALTTFIGIFGGILIYFSIFLFGSQVMRGVIEEKTSRIVEVIVSSVRPFQLMIAKITGIALVGLTQFALWIILTLSIVTIFQASVGMKGLNKPGTEFTIENNSLTPDSVSQNQVSADNDMIQSFFNSLSAYDFGTIAMLFLFYFLFGYLLYGALFAAIGSAVDSESDTQQFMLPITIPLILSIIMAQVIIQDPDGAVAFWFSIIPLTSPVVMMIRIPFGVPYFQVILSMVLLLLGFLGATWLAAKIYRTGILMYGKKVSYKELWKWIRLRER